MDNTANNSAVYNLVVTNCDGHTSVQTYRSPCDAADEAIANARQARQLHLLTDGDVLALTDDIRMNWLEGGYQDISFVAESVEIHLRACTVQ